MGWEKVACWSTKVAIFLKRVKIEEKLLWRAYRKSPTLFRMVLSLTPYGLLFPKIWGFATSKTSIAIISGTGKAMNFKFCTHIYVVSIEIKAIINFGKSCRRRTQGLSKMFKAPIYRAHRTVTFAIAQLSCYISVYCVCFWC